MPRMISTVCALLSFILPLVAAHWIGHHHEVALRARGDMDLHKRQSYNGVRFTYYDVGLGACGQYNKPSDFIVALNVPQYGTGYPGPQCFRSITITYGGKTAIATIMDECEACPNGGLDFSEGLFEYFAPLSVGVLYGEWWYNDGGQSSSDWTPPSTTWAPPVTTSTPDYTPPATSSAPAYTPTTSTQVYTPPPTTSTTMTSTATNSTATTSSTSSTVLSTGWTSGSASQTMGVTPESGDPENIVAVLEIVVRFGRLLSSAQQSG